MALVKGTNSYADLTEANAYFVDRIDGAEWTNASDEVRSQALVSATRILEDQPWVGYATTEDQSLAFPRTGAYFDPSRGRQIAFDSDATEAPDRVKVGCYELALHLILNDNLLDDSGRVQDLGVSGVQLGRLIPASLIPGEVRRRIAPLLQNGGRRGVFVGS